MTGLRDFGSAARLVMLADQALYTGTNFLLGISLAVFVGIQALGHFALIVSVSALMHSLYIGVILEPLTVFGSPAKERRLRAIYAHSAAVVSAVMFLAVGLLYFIGSGTKLGYAIDIALGLAMFGGQSAVLYNKRELVMLGQVRRSFLVSMRYFLGATAAAGLFYMAGEFDEYAVVMAVVVASFVASGTWWIRSIVNRCTLDEVRTVITSVRKYTIWTVVASIPASASIYGIYWIAEFTSSRDVVGMLKLCEQLITPYIQIAMTMSMLDQIESAREFDDAGAEEVSSRLAKRTKAYGFLALSYVALLLAGVAGYSWIGGNILAGFIPALLLYSVIPFLYAVAIPRNVAAKACRKPEFNAYAYFGMAVTVIAAGLIWEPAQLIGLVGLLVAGWLVNASLLGVKVSRMLARMRRAI